MKRKTCIKNAAIMLLAMALLHGMNETAHAHPGQTLALKIDITEKGVIYKVLISADLYRELIPLDRSELKLEPVGEAFRFLDPQQHKREQDAIKRSFKGRNPVTIDGIRVQPIISDMQFMLANDAITRLPLPTLPPDVSFTLSHPTKSRPRRVSMVWEVYPRILRAFSANPNKKPEVWAELDAFDENILVFFSPDEPEMIWHAPGKPVIARLDDKAVRIEEPVPTTVLPVLSIGIVVAWGLTLIGLRFSSRWPQRRRKALVFSIVPLAAAFLCRDVLVARVDTPWNGSAEPPSETEGREVFATLLENIYRAFDYKSESDIYDVLAQSVGGSLLDQVYNEVFQSLIMRDQGGAVARVRSVNLIESRGVPNETETPGSAFRIEGRWQVEGSVVHWGHVHHRTNEYHAIYTIARRGDRWKIIAAEILKQFRVVPQEEEAEAEELEDEEEIDEDVADWADDDDLDEDPDHGPGVDLPALPSDPEDEIPAR